MLMSEKKWEKGVLPRIFDRDPALKKRVEDYLAKIPIEKKEEDLRKLEKFVSGEMTWAEIKGYSRPMLKELAEIAYLKFKMKEYPTAETLFKGLSIIDHTNWYYRAALGAIYQKQGLYEQAVEEYTIALSLNDTELSVYGNRGECHMRLENHEEAFTDFSAILARDPEEKSVWARRARIFVKSLEAKGITAASGGES